MDEKSAPVVIKDVNITKLFLVPRTYRRWPTNLPRRLGIQGDFGASFPARRTLVTLSDFEVGQPGLEARDEVILFYQVCCTHDFREHMPIM